MALVMENILIPAFFAVIVLRIFLIRPHKLGNIISFITIWLIPAYFESLGSFNPKELLIFAVNSALWTALLHWLAKSYDKRREKKKSKSEKSDEKFQVITQTQKSQPETQPKTQASKIKPPIKTQPPKPTQTPKYNQVPKPVPVDQTLNYCLRCRKPLKGPECTHCGFDHTAGSVLFLCEIKPEKLQISIE